MQKTSCPSGTLLSEDFYDLIVYISYILFEYKHKKRETILLHFLLDGSLCLS